MKVTANPMKTKMVGKRPALYARLIYRICERNLRGENLDGFYAAYEAGVERGDLLRYDALFNKAWIDEKYWLNIILLSLQDDMMGARMPMMMAPYHKVEAAGPVAAMMMTAPSIRGFIEPMCRYQPALDPGLIMGIEPIAGGVRVIAHYDGLEGEVAQCFVYSGLYMLEDAMMRVAIWEGDPKPIITVKAPQPSYHQDIRSMYHSNVIWDKDPKRAGSGWTIDIPDELLDIPNYAANSAIHAVTCQTLEEIIRSRAAIVADALEAGEVGGQQTELVRTTLSTALTLLNQAQVAKRVKCEPRTLQKRLKREGTSWAELAEEEFGKRARPAVLSTESSKDIAERMGMTESNFFRKFRKLTGETPKQWLLSQQDRTQEEKIEATRQAASRMRR
jgi:AraC-like DNA-binding protein